MRIALALCLIPLAACGEGFPLENEFREGWSQADVEDCAAEDWSDRGWKKAEQEQICKCAAKRSMKDTSTRDLFTDEQPKKFNAAIQPCADDFDKGLL